MMAFCACADSRTRPSFHYCSFINASSPALWPGNEAPVVLDVMLGSCVIFGVIYECYVHDICYAPINV